MLQDECAFVQWCDKWCYLSKINDVIKYDFAKLSNNYAFLIYVLCNRVNHEVYCIFFDYRLEKQPLVETKVNIKSRFAFLERIDHLNLESLFTLKCF